MDPTTRGGDNMAERTYFFDRTPDGRLFVSHVAVGLVAAGTTPTGPGVTAGASGEQAEAIEDFEQGDTSAAQAVDQHYAELMAQEAKLASN
jgi:hypothetical protein